MKAFLILNLSLLLLMSCSENQEIEAVQDPNWSQDESISMNTTFAAEENQEIENFLNHRPDWKMTKTGTGLRYFVYFKSDNLDTAQVGDQVLVDFSIELLDGTICYTSEENGAEAFIVEKADIESGIHEGIQQMCTGDKSKFILPSHMAHGLIGDENKIPPLTPVIYDIHLIEITQIEP